MDVPRAQTLLVRRTTTTQRVHSNASRSLWNGLVQELIREEMRPPAEQDRALIDSILRRIESYSRQQPKPVVLSQAEPEPGSFKKELAELQRHGLVFPFACSACTYVESGFPTACSLCNCPNETYEAARHARREATKHSSRDATKNSSLRGRNGSIVVGIGGVQPAHRLPNPIPPHSRHNCS